MLDFDNLPNALGLLAFCIFLNILYKRGSYHYPRVLFHIDSNPELQLVILTFFLVFIGILWYSNVASHWNLLASLFSDIYHFLVPRGSAWWLKWVWAGYFGILLTITPIFKTRAALRRIYKKTPLVALNGGKKPSLWALIKECRRLRKVRKGQAQLATFPQDVKVDLEKSSSEERIDVITVDDVEETAPSTIEILTENSAVRRTQARMAMNFQWIYLVAIGCYLCNHLVWNASMSDGWGLYCDMLSVGIMYSFPVSWLMSFLVLYEAAFEHQEAQALSKAEEEVKSVRNTVHEGTPLIVITEDADV